MASELEAPVGWRWVSLADLSSGNTITYGVVQPGADDPHGVPMIRVNNFTANGLDLSNLAHIAPSVEAKYTRTRLRHHDVLITVVGSVGQVAIVPAEAANWNIARAVALIRPADIKLSRWIALCLRSPFSQHSLNVTANTTVQTTVNLKELKQLAIPMPPTREREEIAATLSALDDRIELLRQTNTTLEAIAQALFKSWFVDFDPVRTKAEGREPDGMDAATAALFPDSFEDSTLGLIPRGWQVGTVEDLLGLQRGFDLPSGQRVPGIFPILAASGPSGTHERAMARGPGVTTGRSGVLGRVYFVHDDFWPLNTSLWVKEFRLSTPAYAYQFLRTLDLLHLNAGSAVPTLNRNHVHGVRAVLPPTNVVMAYDRIAVALLSSVKANKDKQNTLDELRDTLLPRLISGKLRLPDAQALIGEATP